jgi:hypothetical protein
MESQLTMMQEFVRRKLEPWPQFVGALVLGSVAHGEGRSDSDLDCVLVFDPMDEGIVPAEFVWEPGSDTFHTIFEVDAVDVGGVQIDAKRMSLADFRTLGWPEGFRHELAHALVLSDRAGTLAGILQERIAYPEAIRRARVEDLLNWADYSLAEWRLLGWLDRGGIECAHDQLTAAFETILQLLHACNGEWMPWRYRWLVSAQRLAWLPPDFRSRALEVTSRVEPTRESLLHRRAELTALLADIQAELQAVGLVSDADEAFLATHPGLGYAHNFDAWRAAHTTLLHTLQ